MDKDENGAIGKCVTTYISVAIWTLEVSMGARTVEFHEPLRTGEKCQFWLTYIDKTSL